MSQELEYTKALIENHINDLRPVKIHLEHQLSLTLEDRILKESQEEIENNLAFLRIELKKAYQAYNYFEDLINKQ